MKSIILEEGKRYRLYKRRGENNAKEYVTDTFSRKFINIGYWRYESIKSDDEDGTSIEIISSIPRIAGNDYFVDNCGELLSKTVNIKHGNVIRLDNNITLNPEIGELLYGDNLTLEVY